MKNFFFSTTLIILLISSAYPQWRKLPLHLHSKSVIITMHGGATFADTDYDKLGANVFGEGSIQYLFNRIQDMQLDLKPLEDTDI